MAPTILSSPVTATTDSPLKTKSASILHAPLKYSGSLDQFKSFDVTSAIGREYPEVQLADLINAPNADTLLRDLAITSTLSYSTHLSASIGVIREIANFY